MSHALKMTQARHKEAILLYSENSDIVELRLDHNNKPVLEIIYNDCGACEFLCLINPQGKYCAIVVKSNCLKILKCIDGSIAGHFKYSSNEKGNKLFVVAKLFMNFYVN